MKTKKPSDVAGAMQFMKECQARGDWQGRAMAEVTNMAFDLGVSWPVDRNAGENDSRVLDALEAIAACEPSASGAAFCAGRAVEAVLELWTNRIVQGNGKTNTDWFYAIADDLVARGLRPTDAHAKVRAWAATVSRQQKEAGKKLPSRAIPTLAAFTTHRAKERAKQ